MRKKRQMFENRAPGLLYIYINFFSNINNIEINTDYWLIVDVLENPCIERLKRPTFVNRAYNTVQIAHRLCSKPRTKKIQLISLCHEIEPSGPP